MAAGSLLHATVTSATLREGTIELALEPGKVLWLRGPSGVGKTLAAMHVLGIQQAPGFTADVTWDPAVPKSERCGVLFQQSALVDSLTSVENVMLAVQADTSTAASDVAANVAPVTRAKQLLDSVGINAALDGRKMPGQLSGGMLRRVSLAQLLAQRKRLILLDEPFVGLDPTSANSIASELKRLKDRGTAFILISHQAKYAALLNPDSEVNITPSSSKSTQSLVSQGMSGIEFVSRLRKKVFDYLLLSVPLIVCASLAAGFAICLMSADVLVRTDVSDSVLAVLEDELSADDLPEMIKALVPLIKLKAKAVIDDRSPELKAMLFSQGAAKLFTLELGPLLTALLLAGRLGGSYAGEVGTMQATNQNRLLKTLNVNPRKWTLGPSGLAALIAGPCLTLLATLLCLWCGAKVVEIYDLDDAEAYWSDVYDATWAAPADHWQSYPPVVLLYRSLAFATLIMVTSETISRWNALLQPRDVPTVITQSVVASSVGIILLDWIFSQVLLRY